MGPLLVNTNVAYVIDYLRRFASGAHPRPTVLDAATRRELEYYEEFYESEALEHFSKPAVVAFRKYLTRHLLAITGAGPESTVLSLGCGIGDTELLIAPHVKQITGVDLSGTAIAQARGLAKRRSIRNARFLAADWREVIATAGRFDVVIAIFFLHHLGDADLDRFPRAILPALNRGGRFYALEPSAHRLSGFLGRLLIPRLMDKYQTEDERQLVRGRETSRFRQAGYRVRSAWFDFVSTPLAGLFPSFRSGYQIARALDHGLTRCAPLNRLSSNFELLAQRPGLQ